MKKSQVLDITWEDLQACLARIKPLIATSDYLIIEALVGTCLKVAQALSAARVSIARLKRFFVGFRTEKSEDLLKKKPQNQEPTATSSPSPADGSQKDKPKRKGHGRLGGDDYPGAVRIPVPHKDLRSGCECPQSGCKGKLHLMKEPSTELRFFGQPFVLAKLWEMEGLRCGTCQEVFRAKTPEEALGPKYDATAVAGIGLLHFGNGIPYKRLEQLQRDMGVPLPASDQAELIKKAGQDLLPVFNELKRVGAQDDLVYNDDTGNRVLSLLRKQREAKASSDKGKGKGKRKGVFTTGIVTTTQDRKIALYFTGAKHAGENLDDLLRLREQNREPAMQMSDGLDRNAPAGAKTVEGKCLTHTRRQFADIIANFPEECGRVVEDIGKVYHVDGLAKERNLSPEDRLFLHQEKSAPIMEGLRRWLVDQLLDDKVEPNSGLGKACAYMLRLWEKLTLFLRKPGAPLDTNIVERALKVAIRYRKNSLFFQTESGAAGGDLFMSLIETCWLNGINAFAYLVALLSNTARLAERPSDWMPWNYQATLAATPPPVEPAAEQVSGVSCPRGPPSSGLVAQL